MTKVHQTVLPIQLEKSDEKLTSLCGLLVLEEMARAKGLWARVDELMPGPGSGRGYRASEFVRPLVWLLTAGGRRLEEVRELRAEQEVLKQLGMKRLPEAGTIGDWLRRVGAGVGIERIGQLNEELIGVYLENQPQEVILDVDATVIEADKAEAEWSYQGVRGYQPMLGYVDGVCVHQEFRPGNEPAGARAVEFLRGCERRLPAGKQIYLRSDSAYYQAEVINQFSRAGRSFSITADQDRAVKEAMGQIAEGQWKKFSTPDGMATDREIAETVHCMEKTEQSFRLIVLRWSNPQPDLFEPHRYCYHAVASNREETCNEVIWRHNGRGESENWHKELKIGFGMEQMPCGQIQANAMFFAIGVLAYNLNLTLKADLLPESYRRCTIGTLRWQLYRMAGKLVRHGRRWILKVKTDSEKLAMLMAVRARCRQMSG